MLILFFGFVATAAAGLGMLAQWSKWRPNAQQQLPNDRE